MTLRKPPKEQQTRPECTSAQGGVEHGQAGESCAPEVNVTRVPTHAGNLRLSERLAFVVMFMAMAAFVVGLSVLAAKFGGRAIPGRSNAASSATERIRGGQQKLTGTGGGPTGRAALDARLSRALSAALRTALGADRSYLSVGVADTATHLTAQYQPGKRYDTANIAGPDILAALLSQHQATLTQVSSRDNRLAAAMIEDSSDTATTRLWRAIGRAGGLVAANRVLGLRYTIPGTGRAWQLTSTTIADQERLLADLATAASPLSSVNREYEFGLLAGVKAADQRFGVPAAARRGTTAAVSDSCLEVSHRWVVDSIGIIASKGHDLLVVILSQGWPTKAAGISAVRQAVLAAAGVLPVSR
jgi:hypothetical protein